MGKEPQIVAVATRITADEAADLADFPIGENTAEKTRVLIRFALHHQDDAVDWFRETEGQHADGFKPAT